MPRATIESAILAALTNHASPETAEAIAQRIIRPLPAVKKALASLCAAGKVEGETIAGATRYSV